MEEVADFEVRTQEAMQNDLRSVFRAAIQTALETLLEEEVEALVGAKKWQRVLARKDFRNGSYFRRLVTSMGEVQLSVPRSRENGGAAGALGRYQRRTDEIDNAIVAAYVEGVSTRKMAKVTNALLGQDVGRSTVSRITKCLEEKIEALRNSPLKGPYPYLYLDATFINARWARQVENVSVLIAYGVGEDGNRDVIGISIGVTESEECWAELLAQLNERGLNGVRLVIADGHSGLSAAVRHHIPEAKFQRCTVHLERNVLTKTPQRLRAKIAREVSEIFNAPSLKESEEGLGRFVESFRKLLPEAVECLEAGFDAATQFFSFPQSHWRRIRSTNTLERLNAEIKRRINKVGAFPDRESALRLITAIAIETSEAWNYRPYLNMKELHTKEVRVAA